jgi:hypothetical protein
MISDYFDDDENVKAMRETARIVGLTDLLERAYRSKNAGTIKELVRVALLQLGVDGKEK